MIGAIALLLCLGCQPEPHILHSAVERAEIKRLEADLISEREMLDAKLRELARVSEEYRVASGIMIDALEVHSSKADAWKAYAESLEPWYPYAVAYRTWAETWGVRPPSVCPCHGVAEDCECPNCRCEGCKKREPERLPDGDLKNPDYLQFFRSQGEIAK